MLEIFLVWRLTVYIGNEVAQKGLKKGRYQVMAVLLWLIGEITGLLLGYVIFGDGSSFWLRYITALIGAIIGAGTAFFATRLLPSQVSTEIDIASGNKKESGMQKFGRSGWIPVLLIILAFSCLCVVAGGASVARMRAMVQQLQATNPIIGSEIGANNQVVQSTEISSNTEIIYLSFYFGSPSNVETPVEFNWTIDGQPAFSFSENLTQGQAVVKLDRNQLGLSEFPRGNYVVDIHIGYMFLNSVSFNVK